MTLTLVLQTIVVLLGIFAFSMPYRDFKTKATPNWLTIPFMIAFGTATIVVALDIFFPILTN